MRRRLASPVFPDLNEECENMLQKTPTVSRRWRTLIAVLLVFAQIGYSVIFADRSVKLSAEPLQAADSPLIPLAADFVVTVDYQEYVNIIYVQEGDGDPRPAYCMDMKTDVFEHANYSLDEDAPVSADVFFVLNNSYPVLNLEQDRKSVV